MSMVTRKLGYKSNMLTVWLLGLILGHGGAVVTHSPPTSEVCSSNPRPYVGKLVVAYRMSAIYSTEH